VRLDLVVGSSKLVALGADRLELRRHRRDHRLELGDPCPERCLQLGLRRGLDGHELSLPHAIASVEDDARAESEIDRTLCDAR